MEKWRNSEMATKEIGKSKIGWFALGKMISQ
jgi:hypothetical protein